jgi:hypothetical protein
MAYIGAGITRFNTADGLTVKGTAEFTDTVVLGDSDELRFGESADLKIYHDASNSYIQDAGTGALILRSNSFQAKSADNTTTMFTGAESGAVELYHNNVKRIETTGSGATVTGGLGVTGSVTADGLTVESSTGGVLTLKTTDTGGLTGDDVGSIDFYNSDISTGSTGVQARILAEQDSNGDSTAIQFYTGFSTGSGSPTLRKRQNVASNGDISFYDNTGTTQGLFWDASTQRLGINTTTPVKALHVDGGASSIAARFSYNGSISYIQFQNDTLNNGYIGYDNSGNLELWTAGSEKVTITSGGLVGIGTNSPDTMLHLTDTTANDGPVIRIEGNAQNAADQLIGGVEWENRDTSGDGPTVTGAIRHYSANSSGSGGYTTFHTHDGTEGGEGSDAVERLRITSDGNVGIGTAAPSYPMELSSSSGAGTQFGITYAPNSVTLLARAGGADANIGTVGSHPLLLKTGNTERMRIDSSGNVGIGTSSPTIASSGGGVHIQDGTQAALRLDHYLNGGFEVQSSSGNLKFYSTAASAERMRIHSSGALLVGKTSTTTTAEGAILQAAGLQSFTRAADVVLRIRRNTNDGTLIQFLQDSNVEGTITVSGSTVSYNGGHLSRWSQLADNTKDTSIVKGTVMTNLDQMAVWHHEAQPATYYEEGDELPEGVSVGDEKTPAVAAYDEDNEQLNCMAVSSVEGDANVAGVFVNWDDDDEDFTADMNIAMTGDMVIRIASGTTVARGDLLMSAGDGTAKPQGDDIVHSKTIAKVTSTNVSHTYDDSSYLVPCVLMAC